MKFKFAKVFFMLATCFEGFVFANATYDTKSVVENRQISAVVNTFLKIAPPDTKITELNYNGFFTLTDDRYMTLIDNTVTFKVTTKLGGIIPLTSQVTIGLAGNMPSSDCNTPNITRAVVMGTNALLDNPIRAHVVGNAMSILRDNVIGQTNLEKYCKHRPKLASITDGAY